MLIVSILAFILIIGAVIFIHEFGHFLIAKRHKVGVAEFSIGFGPKMLSWVKNGTRYCIRWIPFGGYCRMVGDESAFAENLDSETAEETDDEHAFHKKSVWVRIAVIAAGPIFNFVLAFFLSLLLVALVGSQTSKIGGVSEEIAREALRLAMHKLPIKCKFVKHEEAEDGE